MRKIIKNNTAELIIYPVLNNTAVSIISPPLIGRTLIVREIVHNFEKVLPKHKSLLKKTLVLWLDLGLNERNPIQSLIEEINYYLHLHDQHTMDVSSAWKGVEKGIENLLKLKYEKVLFIVDNAHLLVSSYTSIPQKIRKVNLTFPSEFQVLFLIGEELAGEETLRRSLADLFPLYASNLNYMSLPDKEKFSSILKLRMKEVSLRLSADDIKKIHKISGNHPALMRILLREYKKKNSILSNDELLSHVEVRNLFIKTWDSFSKETQNKVRKDSKFVNDYLVKTRLKTKSGKWFSELFRIFISNIGNRKSYVSSSDLIDLLTWQELQVFTLLRNNKGKTVSRDDIAQALWNDEWRSKFSHWAIEQVISTIRKKLGSDKEFSIKTVYKKGFCLL